MPCPTCPKVERPKSTAKKIEAPTEGQKDHTLSGSSRAGAICEHVSPKELELMSSYINSAFLLIIWCRVKGTPILEAEDDVWNLEQWR